MNKSDIEDLIRDLENQIVQKHLTVGTIESEADDIQSEIDSLESELRIINQDFNIELSKLKDMENELSELKDRLKNLGENEKDDLPYSYGAGQTQKETLFDFVEEVS